MVKPEQDFDQTPTPDKDARSTPPETSGETSVAGVERIAKRAADFIKNAGVVYSFAALVLGGLGYLVWVAFAQERVDAYIAGVVAKKQASVVAALEQDRESLDRLVFESLVRNDASFRNAVLDALLQLNGETVDQRLDILKTSGGVTFAPAEDNIAEAATRKLEHLSNLLDSHRELVSARVDSWQSFELYRYFPTRQVRETDQNGQEIIRLEPDTSAPETTRLQHDIIAYPGDNLRLHSFEERKAPGGHEIDEAAILQIRVNGIPLPFDSTDPNADQFFDNFALGCFLKKNLSEGVARRFDDPSVKNPMRIRLSLVTERANERDEFRQQFFIVSSKVPLDEACPQ